MGKKSNAKKANSPKKTVIENPEKIAPPVPAPLSDEDMRKITIGTDGNTVKIISNSTSGNLELISMLQAVLGLIANGK